MIRKTPAIKMCSHRTKKSRYHWVCLVSILITLFVHKSFGQMEDFPTTQPDALSDTNFSVYSKAFDLVNAREGNNEETTIPVLIAAITSSTPSPHSPLPANESMSIEFQPLNITAPSTTEVTSSAPITSTPPTTVSAAVTTFSTNLTTPAPASSTSRAARLETDPIIPLASATIPTTSVRTPSTNPPTLPTSPQTLSTSPSTPSTSAPTLLTSPSTQPPDPPTPSTSAPTLSTSPPTSSTSAPTPPPSLCSPINPCENGGDCYEFGNSNFTCNCKRGYSGHTCSEQYNACSRNPCENNGTCNTQPPSDLYVCDCAIGYSGINCEHEIDDCLGVNCTNGKICVDLGAEYECRCPDGYTGINCSSLIPVDHCLGVICPPGHVCYDLQGSAKCDCPFGYMGVNCTIRIGSDFWGKYGSTPSGGGYCGNLADGVYRCQNGHCEMILDPPPKEHDEEEEIINTSHDNDQEDNGHEGHDNSHDVSTPGSTQDPSISATSNSSSGSDVDVVFIIIVTSACLLIVIVLVVLLYSVRSVKRARATRGTYSPSAQEMFGNSASEILKPPPEERLI